jgi:catalase
MEPRYLEFNPAIEKPADDEHVVFDELSRSMQHIGRKMAARYRHAYRPVHAKSHGLLVGYLDISGNLPVHLRQGLFGHGGHYPVVMRFSTNPGDILPDSVSTPRGLAVKVLHVDGAMVAEHEGCATQDFVCVNANNFTAPDARGFLSQIKVFDKTLDTPDLIKQGVSVAARAANAVLKAIHLPSAALEGLGESATHILGESFSTVLPIRFGKYICKLGLAPASDNLKALTGTGIDLSADYNALEELIQKFFHNQQAVWDVRVQLALAPEANGDIEKGDFPVERADVEWPEAKSAWQNVGRIVVDPQNSYSDARQLFVDERMSFSPWHALEAHCPLGGLMRARRKAYVEAARFRIARNQRVAVEPKTISEIPD